MQSIASGKYYTVLLACLANLLSRSDYSCILRDKITFGTIHRLIEAIIDLKGARKLQDAVSGTVLSASSQCSLVVYE